MAIAFLCLFNAHCVLFLIEQTERGRSFSRSDPHLERDEQFAPPAFYYEENTGDKTTKNSWKEPPKLFKYDNKTHDKSQELQHENRQTTPQGQQQTDFQPQVENQYKQTPAPHPDFPPLPPPPQEYVQPPWTGYQWPPLPNMLPPHLSHQLPWQPRFPVNVPPPPPSLWQPNMPPWQHAQGPFSVGAAPPFPNPQPAWSESAPISNTPPVPGRGTQSDSNVAMSSGNLDIDNIEKDSCQDRTVPSKQKVADFVAQLRSSS